VTLRSWLRYGPNPPGLAWAKQEHPWDSPHPVVCTDPCWIVGRGGWVGEDWWPWLPWRLFHTVLAHYRKGRLYGYPLCCILEFCWDDIVCRTSGDLRGNTDPDELAGWVPCRRCLRRPTVRNGAVTTIPSVRRFLMSARAAVDAPNKVPPK
jgi:hypothetical protein